ncbi:preprotein translocase subunit YajC [Allorhodopirellula solitaria]|uniref:preprotein translocase subunit YajC n=1 Tax=Allorhodopirellula solitaria TaxID=2527987 RepID=UPI001FE97E41|nr:preprotein translocase subunit YajC [Allorhodopirellula solitaria]
MDPIFIEKANEFLTGTPVGRASDWAARLASPDTWITQAMLLAQDGGAEGAKPVGPQNIWEAFFASPLPLIAGLAMIWYVTWFLPEKRKRQNETNLLASLTKNDRVVTIGGLHGTVVSATADSDVITLKIDEAGTTRIKVNRSAVAAITEHAKGKPLGKDGKPGTAQQPGKVTRGESPSKNASGEESSD